jgi:hypothetical protein
MQMAEYFTNSTDAVTGETTQIPWTQEQIAAYLARRAQQAAAQPLVVPQSITPRQCRLILSQQGLLAQVEALIALSDEPTRITWEYALEFRRDDPLLNGLATQLGLTGQQIDAFFTAASQL